MLMDVDGPEPRGAQRVIAVEHGLRRARRARTKTINKACREWAAMREAAVVVCCCCMSETSHRFSGVPYSPPPSSVLRHHE